MHDELDLAQRIAAEVTGRRATFAVRLGGGFANDMVRVDLEGGDPVVVRIYRRAPAVAAIEAAVLARAATFVPVPAVLKADAAGAITGRPAIVLGWTDGEIAQTVLASAAPEEALAIAARFGTALAGLEKVTFAAPGFFTGPALAVDPWKQPPSAMLASFLATTAGSPGARALGADVFDAWRAILTAAAPLADTVHGTSVLVHGDFNPKNVVLRRDANGAWAVAALIDWEFAFSGSSLFDVGNFLRYEDTRPAGYGRAFAEAYRAAGGALPERWREIAAVLDAFSLCQFLQKGPTGPFFVPVRDLLTRTVRRGTIAPGCA